MDELEEELRRRLYELEARYRAEAKPLIDLLVQLESLKPPMPLILSPDQLEQLAANIRANT